MKLSAALLLILGLVACTSSKNNRVKQAGGPGADEFAESGDSDIAAAEKTEKPIIKDPDQLKKDCVAACAESLAKDKSGDDPAKIPCVDFTADIKEECLNYFRKTPMMAADAKAAAAAAPAPAKPEE
jgi:hypothetical protein